MSKLPCPLRLAAAEAPDAPAYIAPHRTYTFSEAHAFVTGAAANLRRSGLSEGDILAIALPNGLPYPIVLLALWRLRAIACPMNPRQPMDALLGHLHDIRCKDIMVPYGAAATAGKGRLFPMAPVDVVDETPVAPDAAASVDADRPATIVFTSGSSARPKAALHRLGNHLVNAERANANMPLAPGDRWLLSLPLYHVAGLGILFRCLLGRAAVVIPGAQDALHHAIERYEVTHVSLVPTQLHRLLNASEGRAALRRLRAALVGGAPIPEALAERALGEGVPLVATYGLTETASQLTATVPGGPPGQLGTAGRPLTPETLRIGPGGEIQAAGDTLFLGYVENGELRPHEAPEGWFSTGDLGEIDAEGRLRVRGRRDNMFIAGGENIQPEEIEALLRSMDGVDDALVVPVPDAEYGAVPVAFLRCAEAPPTLDAVREWLAPHLPRFKLPRAALAWPDDLAGSGMKPRRPDFIRRAVQSYTPE